MVISLAAPIRAQEAAPDADEIVVDEVDFLRDATLRLTIPVTIAGKGPFRFFIDTGAQATIVTPRVMETAGLLPSGTARLIALGSTREVETVELDGLTFANRTLDGLTVFLLRTEHLGVDGILGLDSLQDLRVLIDLKAGSMAVADGRTRVAPSKCEIVVRARRQQGQMIITSARLNGVRTAVIIDTGAENTIGNLALLAKLRARTAVSGSLVQVDAHDFELTSQAGVLGTLDLGGVQLSEVPVGFADGPAFEALGFAHQPALLLGMRNLRAFDRVAIDFANRRVLFDVPDELEARDLLRRQSYASRLDW